MNAKRHPHAAAIKAQLLDQIGVSEPDMLLLLELLEPDEPEEVKA